LLLASLTDAPANARLSFTGGGLGSAAVGDEWLHSIRVTSAHTVVLPPGTAAGRVTRMSLNAATGVFTGAFELTDPGTPIPIKRTASFSGLISSHLYSGSGLFLLPQLPDSNGTPPTTLKTSRILSGRVYWTAP
jgi:hypothetical protein